MAGEKCFTQSFMEGFGLEFPKDSDRLLEILERFDNCGGTMMQLFDDVVEAFPEKKERITGLSIYTRCDKLV